MTVCIAAACEGGARIVSATDGLISTEDVTSDSLIGKMSWLHEWQFLYAGTPANVALIRWLIEQKALKDIGVFSRERVQKTVRDAYRRFVADFSSFETLNAFDMTLEEFKTKGREFFGEEFHNELSRKIRDNAAFVRDQLLVTGWGLSPISAMIYEIGPSGEALHSDTCFAAIGSGAQLAQSMLMLLGQARDCTLAETIFNVACAKFSAEKSAGMDIGQRTAMYVSRKRKEDEPGGRSSGDFVQEPQLKQLRQLWESHLKPRIPDEAWQVITRISASLSGGKGTMKDMAETVNAVNRIQTAKFRSYEEIKATIDRQGLQSTTDDQSHQTPPPGSPGETDES